MTTRNYFQIIPTKPKILEILRQARILLEKGWIQNGYSRNKNDYLCPINSPEACKFCLTGAIFKAAKGYEKGMIFKYIINNVKKYESFQCLANWNDYYSRTQKQVLNLIDKTIKQVEKEIKKDI